MEKIFAEVPADLKQRIDIFCIKNKVTLKEFVRLASEELLKNGN